MTQVVEPLRITPTNTGPSVIAMAPGDFWLRAGECGISIEETTAFQQGQVSQERAAEICTIIRLAANALAAVPGAGCQFWMTPRRAMS